MTPPDPFFKSPKSWSQRKHRILRKYLQPFIAKVGSLSTTVYCVDGFAGVGKYEDGKPGSPLLTAQLADEAGAREHSVKLKIVNVEADDANFESLAKHTLPWQERGVVRNLHGKFKDLVPDILREIGNIPAFFFVDPFGPTGLPFSSLQPILERRQRVTELIINFDLDGLRRIADSMRSKGQTARTRKTIETDMQWVTDILGIDDWKVKFTDTQLATEARERVLLDLYTKNLQKFGYAVVRYPIRKSLRGSPKYYLIYCTRHPDGVMLMNDIIRDEEDALLKEFNSPPQQPTLPSEDFDPVRQHVLRRREILGQLVLAQFREVQRSTRGSMKKKFKFEHFGEFHERDYTAAFKDLVDRGLLKTQHGLKRFNDNVVLTYEGE